MLLESKAQKIRFTKRVVFSKRRISPIYKSETSDLFCVCLLFNGPTKSRLQFFRHINRIFLMKACIGQAVWSKSAQKTWITKRSFFSYGAPHRIGRIKY